MCVYVTGRARARRNEVGETRARVVKEGERERESYVSSCEVYVRDIVWENDDRGERISRIRA